jgi:transcriptional regulator with XRE-family HTH domain
LLLQKLAIMKISRNIAHLRKIRGVSQELMADELDITRSRLSSWEESRASPPIELLIKLSEYFSMSIDSLVKVDLTRVEDLRDLLKIGGNRILFPVMVDREGNDMIEVVPVKASAGYLKGYADETFIETLPRISLPYAVNGKYRGFPIMGDSMPPLEGGSFVIGRFIEELEEIKDGKTYVILTKTEGLVYKRAENKIADEGVVRLHSDNKVYLPFNIKAEDIQEVWEFVCSLNPTDSPYTDLLYESLQNIQADVAILKQRSLN